MGHAAVIEAVARHSARAAARVHIKMKRGLSSLASIAATAPFVGLLPTVLGMKFSVNHGGGDGPIMMAVAGGIAESLITTALGLLVAIVASWSYTYLSNKLETLDLEMQNASLDLVDQLILYGHRQSAVSKVML